MIVFPMSGLSSRFSKAGYLSNKYKLDLYGNSVFHHIVSQFKKANLTDGFIFIHNGNDFDENFISQTCNSIGLKTGEYHIVKLNGETRGQAETVFKGIENINFDKNERLIIYNIDSIRLSFDLPKEIKELDVDGYLEVFEGEGDHWSFALPKDKDSDELFLEVEEVAEKQRISKYCSNGLYHFKSFNIFKDAYENELEKFDGKGELFVAPLYNNLIKNKKNVYMRMIPATSTVFCGTPDEYEGIINASIPTKIIPSEEYIANRVLSYTADGISQKNYFKVMDIIKFANPIVKNDHVFKALTVFFNYYGCYSRIVEYSHMHFTKFGMDKDYQDIYIYLRKLIFGFIKNSLNVQHDSRKAVNLMSVLITVSGQEALKKHPKEFREIAPYLSIPDHLKIFRILRHKIDDRSLLSLTFDESNRFNSVSYLFLIFCLAYRLEDNEKYLEFIKNNIDNSLNLRKGDSERKLLIKNLLIGMPEPLFNQSTKDDIRVAILITGQMRDYSTVADYFNNLKTQGINYDIYLSTWEKSGQPPCHLGSLRGYDSKIRTAIRNRASKFMVSNNEFVDHYHLRKNDLVDKDIVRSSFQRLKWMKVDIEGNTTREFNSNQERLYFKINQAYKEASKIDYDAYIRVRPDLNFSLDTSTLVNCIRKCVTNENLIFVRDAPLTDMYMPFLDDNFAIASPKAMESYAALYDFSLHGGDTLPLDPFKEDIRPHSSLAYQLFLDGMNVKFIKGIENWTYNDISTISASEYITYLKSLNKDKLNIKFIDSVIFKLRTVK